VSPPSGDERYLAPSERVLYSCRRHPIVLAKALTIWTAALVAGAGAGFVISPRSPDSLVDQIAGAVVLAFTFYLAAHTGRWLSARYLITDQRVLLVEGILSKKVSAIPLSKVTDTTYHRTMWGRLFGYGDLMLDAPGEKPGLSTLTYLPRPDALYRLIMGMVVGDGTRTGWGAVKYPDPDATGPIPRVR
jgi:membrane protein YdbS with pleckstrin-like domain